MGDLLVDAWQNLHGEAPPEDLPRHPVDALYELLPTDLVEVGTGHRLGLGDPPEDPWRKMIVGHEPEASLRSWVFEAAQLLIIGRGPEEEWLAVDEEEDPNGNNRVYIISQDGRSPQLVFSTVENLIAWIASPSSFESPDPDNWSAHISSVERSLELLWQQHPADLFNNYLKGTWPSETSSAPQLSLDDPGFRRTALLWTLLRFRLTKEVQLPQGLEREDVCDVHRDLLRHLEDLQDAIDLAEVPVLVADLALDDDQVVSQAAMDWMIAFDRTIEASKKASSGSEEASPVMAEKTQGLLVLLQQTIEELIRRELIELSDQQKVKLIEEMLEAVFKAGDPYSTVPSIIETLLESSFVEEVYAEDAELEGVISRTLGLK